MRYSFLNSKESESWGGGTLAGTTEQCGEWFEIPWPLLPSSFLQCIPLAENGRKPGGKGSLENVVPVTQSERELEPGADQ